jgi:hypothetical protein
LRRWLRWSSLQSPPTCASAALHAIVYDEAADRLADLDADRAIRMGRYALEFGEAHGAGSLPRTMMSRTAGSRVAAINSSRLVTWRRGDDWLVGMEGSLLKRGKRESFFRPPSGRSVRC